MNPNISAQMCNKSEKIVDPGLQNEEYDPYIIVILNQLWWSTAEVASLLYEMIFIENGISSTKKRIFVEF